MRVRLHLWRDGELIETSEVCAARGPSAEWKNFLGLLTQGSRPGLQICRRYAARALPKSRFELKPLRPRRTLWFEFSDATKKTEILRLGFPALKKAGGSPPSLRMTASKKKEIRVQA